VLPADYTFTLPDDGGSHTLTDTGLGETTLITPGAFTPSGYTFQAGDMGTAVFQSGATLNTAGSTWDVTATDTGSGITGSAYVTVSAGPAPHRRLRRRTNSPASPFGAAPAQTALDYLFASRDQQ
jgi:hypothetical protein